MRTLRDEIEAFAGWMVSELGHKALAKAIANTDQPTEASKLLLDLHTDAISTYGPLPYAEIMQMYIELASTADCSGNPPIPSAAAQQALASDKPWEALNAERHTVAPEN